VAACGGRKVPGCGQAVQASQDVWSQALCDGGRKRVVIPADGAAGSQADGRGAQLGLKEEDGRWLLASIADAPDLPLP